MFPRIGTKLLEDSQAVTAKNCRLKSGEIRPLRDTTLVSALSKVGSKQSIYLFGGSFWFHWVTDVDCVRGPIPTDTTEKTYWTGDGAYPKATNAEIATSGGTNYPMAHWRLGIPAPANTITAAGAGGTYDPAELEARSYVYTYVSGWGEEGPPSNPSSIVTVGFDEQVNLSNMSAAPTGAYNIVSKRIYRTNMGTTGSDWQLVAEIPVANTTYPDTKVGDELGEILQTTYWDAPPDAMKGLITMANGVMAGFDGLDVYLSEPYQPHAWPRSYMQTVDYPVVGIGSFQNTIVVCTEGNPYLIVGIHPESTSLAKVEFPQACVSKRSIATIGGIGVAYASPDGLCVIGSAGAKVVTEKLLSRDEWQAYNPSSMHAYVHDGQYIVCYDNGTPGVLIIDTEGGGLIESDIDAAGGYLHLETDSLYLIISDAVRKWDAGSNKSFTWKSKVFTGSPRSYSAAQVIGNHPVTFTLYGDGAQIHSQAVTSDAPFRLPAGKLCAEYQIQITGTNIVHEVRVGHMGEMI